MGLEELESWTLRELEHLARRLGISLPIRTSRPELLSAIARRGEAEGGANEGWLAKVLRFARSLTSPPPPMESAQGGAPRNPTPREETVEPIATKTMARLLSDQGHHERALSIYRRLVAERPDDPALRAQMLRSEQAAMRSAATWRASTSPSADGSPPDETQEVVAVAAGDANVLISWQVHEPGISAARALLEGPGALRARVVIVAPDEVELVKTTIRERDAARAGEWLLTEVPEGARLTASLGLAHQELFVSITHSPVVQMPAPSRS